MASLPKCMGLKSVHNAKYLSFISADSEVHGLLKFSSDEVVTPYSKFMVEPANTGNGSYIHIRSAYNNKYWVRWSENHWWIAASADEPNEDPSSWSCTLFEPSYLPDNTIRLRHVQLGHYACLWEPSAPYTDCLFAGYTTTQEDKWDVFAVTNLETLFVLPKHIAFIGHNGLYLKGIGLHNHPYLQFSSSDVHDSSVWFESFLNNNDGTVRIKSDSFAKFLRRNSDNWIFVDADDSNVANPDNLFVPTVVEESVVALRNLGNNNYCKRFTVINNEHCLAANVSTITDEAKMHVEETVSSRLIKIVEYKDLDMRMFYNRSTVILASQVIANYNTDKPEREMKVTLSFTNIKSKAWNSTVFPKIFSKVTIKGGVPSSPHISDSHTVSKDYKWGDNIETTTEESVDLTVKVPANSTLKLNYIATKYSVDVPFSYTQEDTLFNGNQIISNFEDGLSTFTSLSDFNSDISIQPFG